MMTYTRISLSLFLPLLFTYCGAILLFAIGAPLGGWLFPIATLAGILAAGFFPGHPRISLKGVLIPVGIIISAIIICCFTDDYSYDGNGYHQEIMVRILRGWNPITNPEGIENFSPWVIHYAKGMEIIGASIASLTGKIETGRAANIMLMAAAFSASMMILNWLDKRFPALRLSKRTKILLAIVIMANPVCMAQMLSFYNDFALYCLLLMIIAFSILILTSDHKRDRRQSSLIIASLMIFAAAVKFTTLFYAGIAICFIVIFALLFGDNSSFRIKGLSIGLWGLGGIIIGIFIGYNPYITNTLIWGNPFYPLIGSDTTDIMTINTPEIFADNGRIINFAKSLFTVEFPKYDSRIGGFGPLAPLMLLISGGVVLSVLLRPIGSLPRKVAGGVLYLWVVTLLSCFIFSQSWWARYIPQFWLAAIAGSLFFPASRGLRKWSGVTLIICACATGGVSLAGGIIQGSRYHLRRQAIYRKASDPVIIIDSWPSAEYHFSERGFNVIAAEDYLSDMRDEKEVAFYGADSEPGYPKIILKE